MRPELGSDASFVTVKPCNSGASANMHDPHNAQSSCHVHAVWRRCVCPLIGATATSKNEVFDFATDETATLHESYTKKRPIFDHRLRFSMWSRQKNYDPISLKPHDREPHLCELANKKTEQLCNVSSPCLDDHQFKKEKLESAGELSKVCSQIVLKCLYLARMGRPDFLWSVNKLARSITKMD